MQLGGIEVQLHVSPGLLQTVVVLLRGNAADRVRGVHDEPEHVLVRLVRLLDLVVYGPVMLTADATLATIVGMTLAAAAGLSQVFSP